MPQHYAFIIGSKGYNYSVASRSSFGDKLKEYYNDDDKAPKINVVAVGPNNYYAVVSSEGCAWHCGPDGFGDKLKEIRRTEIKHISFGYNDQWAITMKNGWCHASLQPDPLRKVNEHNGDISYVSLGPRQSDWIVGWGNNGYANGGGVPVNVTSFLKGINVSKKKILLVELGTDNNYFVDHEEGYRWSLPNDASEWFKNRSHPLASVSLW